MLFKHILVPLDSSALAECVLPHLVALSRIGADRITLLRVLQADTGFQPVDPFDWQLRKAEAEAYLRNVADRLEGVGVRTETLVEEGRAAESVLECSEEQAVDLILMSSHGKSGLTGWNVSSVVQKIILRARRSIMIVRAYQPVAANLGELRYERILLPLDGSTRAEVALPFAGTIARTLGGRILAAHFVREPEVPRRTPLGEDELQLVASITERNRVEISRYLDDVSARLDSPVDIHLAVEANPGAALNRLAESENVDLVVMSAHGYSGDVKVPYGSTVIGFIAYGIAPVMVIQDLPAERIEPTLAEIMAQEQGRRS